jgi:ligand-binding sensor domain-containing protein
MIFPRWMPAALVAAVMLSGSALPAAAAGPWTSFLRARTVTDVVADTSEVWSATLEGGLLHYDRVTGVTSQVTREPDGLAGNQLNALAVDRSGRLWVGTQGNGLSFLSADRKQWGLVNQFDGLPSDTVNVLTVDGDTLWIGSTRGISLWDGRQIVGSLPNGVDPSPFRIDHVTGIVRQGDTLYVSTLNGVYRSLVSTRLETWVALDAGLPTPRVEMLAGDGRDLFAFTTGTTWISARRLSGSAWVSQGGLGGVRAIHEERKNILVTTASGIFRWNGSGYTQVPGAPISRTDRTLWIEPGIAPDGQYYGANRDGLHEQTATVPWPIRSVPQPPGNNITNVMVFGSRMYVNTFAEGIGRFDGTRWKYWLTAVGGGAGPCRAPACDADTSFLNPAFAFALIEDDSGRVWVSNWGVTDDQVRNPGALERLDDSTDPPSFDRISHWPDTLTVASVRHTFGIGSTRDSLDGGIWIGMDSAERENPDFTPIGIDRYDRHGNWVATYGPSSNGLLTGRILSLTTDHTGRIWIATAGSGVQYFDWDDPLETAPTFNRVSPPDNVDVRGIAVAGDSVWAQTTNDVRIYSRRSPTILAKLPVPAAPSENAGNTVEVAPDGSIWVGTVNGIRVYNRDGSIRTNYTVANSPIGSDDIKVIRTDRATGQIWVGTSAGLSRFDPGYTPPTSDVPPLDVFVYPNPARLTNLGAGLRLRGNVSTYFGAVYDLGGRRVNSFSDVPEGGVVWNGLDHDGKVVRPGVYFVHVRSGSRSTLVRAVMIR